MDIARYNKNIREAHYKKKILAICFIVALTATILCGISVSAAETATVDSFKLSTESGKIGSKTRTFNVSGGGPATLYARFWKGSWNHSDTARSQVKSASGLTSTSCYVATYGAGNKLTNSGKDATYIDITIGWGKATQRTNHIITAGNGKNSVKWTVNGNK